MFLSDGFMRVLWTAFITFGSQQADPELSSGLPLPCSLHRDTSFPRDHSAVRTPLPAPPPRGPQLVDLAVYSTAGIPVGFPHLLRLVLISALASCLCRKQQELLGNRNPCSLFQHSLTLMIETSHCNFPQKRQN